MTQQIIDVGPLPNDGLGDPLRTAFQITNDNFANIWAAGPVDSQVVISNNVISTNQTNLELILQGNGIGTVTLDSTTVPGIDAVYDLGSPTQRFDSLYGQYFYGNGRFLTGVVAEPGTGNVTFAPTPPLYPNIGDIWIQSTNGVQYLYFNDNTSNQWAELEAFQSFSSGGNGTGNIDLTDVSSDIIPSSPNSYSLGNSARQWQDIWVSNGTIYMNGVAITSDGANLKYNGNTILTTSSALTYANLTVTGNIVANNVKPNAVYTDNYYYANGAPFPQGSNAISGTTISLKDNQISTTVTNQNLIIKANGIGVVQVNTSIVPGVDDAYDLGNSTRNWETVYAGQYIGNAATFTSNIAAAGNISGNYILGNGYFLTGIGNGGGGNVDLTYIQTNVVPASNTLNIGNVGNQWNTLWVANTINLNSVPMTMVGNTLRVNNVSMVSNGSSPSFSSISVTGNTRANAVYTDNYFYANGAPFPQGSNSVPGTTISLKDNVISTTVTNQSLVLKGNGIGNVQANSSIMPSIDDTYDIGSATYRFDTVYAGYFVGNGSLLTGISGGGNASLGNWAFTGNTIYNINGGVIDNSDLSHGATASLTLPINGNTSPVSVLNYYGNFVVTTGINAGNTRTMTYNNIGSLSLPGQVSAGAVAYTNVDGVAGQILKTYGNGQTYWGAVNTGYLSVGLRSGTMSEPIYNGEVTIVGRAGNVLVPVSP